MSAEKLRYIEYYNMQETFDWLYKRSEENRTKGLNLYDLIHSKNNILLAYRMIKTNTGSKTKGIDGLTIDDYKIQNVDEFIQMIRNELKDYHPTAVRRVEIPKKNGKTRPLGIPTMKDRLIQQMIKQVIEPICEAKFYKHSYGFRPLRSAHHAIARCNFIMHKCKCHYVVDVDIRSFFDYVNHTKLLHQLYTIGIKDKRVLAIISKMLKAPIKGEGIPTCGTPQGGILSPLLSNVVLNDVDWWIANQWETFTTRYVYSNDGKTYRALRKTKLKEMHIVRYADDSKIFTTNYKDAWKIFHAFKGYLKNYLGLDISSEKSQVTNLRRRYTEFLGFELKVVKKSNKYVSISKISDKSKHRITREYRKRIDALQKERTKTSINKYNSFIMGVQNYFKVATRVNVDLSGIYYQSMKHLYNHLKSVAKYGLPRSPPVFYRKRYSINQKTFKMGGQYLFPLSHIKWTMASAYQPKKNIYTAQGRLEIHEKLLDIMQEQIQQMSKMMNDEYSIEYYDNRISRYSMQRGECCVTGIFLYHNDIHCHHMVPVSLGGTDKYENLVIVHEWVHKLIHATNKEKIEKYMKLLNLSDKQKVKINKLRIKCNLTELT